MPKPIFGLMVALTLAGCVTDSNQDLPQLKQGNAFARDGLYREAVDQYKSALVSMPEHPAAHRNLGMVLVKTGDYQGAITHLEAAMKRYSDDFDANFYLAEAYRAKDRFADAIFRYQSALRVEPKDSKALKALAWTFFRIRYYAETLATVRRLKREDPSDHQATIIEARALLKLHRDKEALALVQKTKEQLDKKTLPFFLSVEGDILAALGDRDRALATYREALRLDPLLAGALLGQGQVLLDRGDASKAIPFLERAVRVRPNMAEGHLALGKAYSTIDRKKAAKYYSYFAKLAANDPEFTSELPAVRRKLAELAIEKS